MSKKKVALICCFVTLILLAGQPLLASQAAGNDEEMPVSVRIHTEELDFPEQKPVIYQGRVMVPARRILECDYVQAKVLWDEKNQLAVVYDQRGYKVVFKPGDMHYYVITDTDDVRKYPLDVPAMIINGRLLIPVRAFMEAFEYYVQWLPEVRWVQIRDFFPAWRKLKPSAEWQEELSRWKSQIQEEGGSCLPCLLKKGS